MLTTGPVIPITHIRTAVTTLVAGLLLNQTIHHDDWDTAVSTLGRSHEQLGGTTRRHLYATLAAAHPDTEPDELRNHLTALANSLNVPTTPDTTDQLPLF